MVIHTFGGYYGLAVSWMLYRPNLDQSSRLQGSVYHSDVFAMIGRRGDRPHLNMLILPLSWRSFHMCLSLCFSGRYSLPVDVLA